MFNYIAIAWRVLGDLMNNRAELERDCPEILALVDDWLAVWNKHQAKVLPAIPRLVPIVQRIIKDAK